MCTPHSYTITIYNTLTHVSDNITIKAVMLISYAPIMSVTLYNNL